MVLDRTPAMTRPRREAAVLGVKAATGTLTSRSTTTAAQKAQAGTSTQTQGRRSAARPAREASASSDGSDREDEGDSDADEEAASEEEESVDAESEQEELSEPEYDMDNSGDFGAPSKRKAGNGVAQKKATAKKAKEPARSTKAGKNAVQTKARATKKIASTAATGKAAARRMANKETLPINEDNKLFNCIRDNVEDLKTVADDWIAYYLDNPPAALAQFVNCVLRSCGCNETVDEVQVEDTEDIVPVLTEVQEHFKTQSMPSYPLVTRAPAYKHFRRNLGTFIKHCLTAADEADALLDDKLTDTLVAWTGAMTSSSYRAFRHTATVFALLIMGQIARVAHNKREPLGKLMRTRDAEKRKSTAARARDLDQQVENLDGMIKELDTHFKELFQAVFQHRFRDADAAIRMECMAELGRWMASLPDQFLTSAYLLYPGWTLTDPDEQVRLATVQRLASLYARHGTRSSIQTFTTRFLPRLLEMATSDISVGVRVATINLLGHTDKAGAIDEASRDSVAAHIFDVEPRVRSAVAKFVSSMIETEIQSDVENDAEDETTALRRFKGLAVILVRLGAAVDASDADVAESSATANGSTRSRNAIALEDLWSANAGLREWQPLLACLQLDHSGTDASDEPRGRRGARQQKEVNSVLDEQTRLEPAEESILVEALPVFMEKAQKAAGSSIGKQAAVQEAERIEAKTQMTKDLLPVLGKLFNKYRTESGRMQNVLRMPALMDLGLYLEYQELGSYEDLWDQVVNQFNRHTEEDVLASAVEAIVALQATHAMSAVNDTKAQSLREATATAFNAAARAELRRVTDANTAELQAASSRLHHLMRKVDVSTEVEDTDEDHHSSAWDYLLQVAQNAIKAGNAWEKIATYAVRSMPVFIMWKLRSLMQLEDSDAKDIQVADLADKRHDLLVLLGSIVEGPQASSGSELIRESYRELLDIHILFATMEAVGEADEDAADNMATSALPEKFRLDCEGSLQDKFASYVAEEILRFEQHEEDDAASRNDSQLQPSMQAQVQSMRSLKRQYALVNAISHYIGAIRLGVIDLRQCVPLLAKYGTLGHLFDACLRVCIDALREAGIYQKRSEYACRIILDALKESFALTQDDERHEANFVALSRQLSSCLVVRGAQLAVTGSMPASAVVNLHEQGISFALDNVQAAMQDDGDEDKEHALSFFKALSNLLVGLNARDALSIKLNFSNALKARDLQVPTSGEKEWDALRTYEKRLVTLASKSDAFVNAVRASSPVPVASSPVAADKGPISPLAAADAPSCQRPRPRARAASSAAASRADVRDDDDDVESVLGGRGELHDDTLADLSVPNAGIGLDSMLSVPALDVSDDDEEADEEGAAADASLHNSQRPTRQTRRRATTVESEDDEEPSQSQVGTRKRARRS